MAPGSGSGHAWPCAHLLLPDTWGSREEPGEAKALPQSPPEPPARGAASPVPPGQAGTGDTGLAVPWLTEGCSELCT